MTAGFQTIDGRAYDARQIERDRARLDLLARTVFREGSRRYRDGHEPARGWDSVRELEWRAARSVMKHTMPPLDCPPEIKTADKLLAVPRSSVGQGDPFKTFAKLDDRLTVMGPMFTSERRKPGIDALVACKDPELEVRPLLLQSVDHSLVSLALRAKVIAAAACGARGETSQEFKEAIEIRDRAEDMATSVWSEAMTLHELAFSRPQTLEPEERKQAFKLQVLDFTVNASEIRDALVRATGDQNLPKVDSGKQPHEQWFAIDQMARPLGMTDLVQCVDSFIWATGRGERKPVPPTKPRILDEHLAALAGVRREESERRQEREASMRVA